MTVTTWNIPWLSENSLHQNLLSEEFKARLKKFEVLYAVFSHPGKIAKFWPCNQKFLQQFYSQATPCLLIDFDRINIISCLECVNLLLTDFLKITLSEILFYFFLYSSFRFFWNGNRSAKCCQIINFWLDFIWTLMGRID